MTAPLETFAAMTDPLEAYAGGDRVAIAASRESSPNTQVRNTSKPKPDPPQPEVVVRCLADFEPCDVEFLWQDKFPLGMVSVIAGDPGAGKSTLSTDVAARVSAGIPWPDSPGVQNPAGDVILLVGEDGFCDTVRKRVDAAGGDARRITVIEGVRSPDEPDVLDPFSIDQDLPRLHSLLEERPSTRLIVIDPLDCFLGHRIDTHKKSEVQRSLARLSKLAEAHKVAVIGVLHLKKSSGDKAVYRTLGSLGFVSSPRAVWALTRAKEDRATRLLTCIKLNVVADPPGLSFTIEDAGGCGVIRWLPGTIDITADEAMDAERQSAKGDAVEWLSELLLLGPVSSSKITKAAGKLGISWGTLRRAQETLGIRPRKSGSGWFWELPVREDNQDAQA